MYYSYYMLPDGTYCFAPPPPGIDVATYYSALPAGVTVSSTTGVATIPPPPGTTPPPPPDAAEADSGLTSSTTSARYAIYISQEIHAFYNIFKPSRLYVVKCLIPLTVCAAVFQIVAGHQVDRG